ncbi:hypothetical protein SLEP1_g494 [Rubroshorea leprosula]|uniref:Uncharacterized protein n=1 Tax=Rubroshorea leprosula TaxID=152421 RepID=A0AAV5HGC4_9ROSI|nr:hypothetical protein SLEP1_g494 [Rubroshorea leprosula]
MGGISLEVCKRRHGDILNCPNQGRDTCLAKRNQALFFFSIHEFRSIGMQKGPSDTYTSK